MNIEWLGQACVRLTSESGTRIIFDPYRTGYHAPPDGVLSYQAIDETADVVVVTHEHPDHNNVGVVKGNPEIVRGDDLTQSGPRTVRGITFRSLPCYHDHSGGTILGNNNMVLFEMDRMKVCHTGDVGHVLSAEQIEEIGSLDVLFLCVGLLNPVGEPQYSTVNGERRQSAWGGYIVDADVANDVYAQLEPRVTIPIHFGNEKCSFHLVGVDEFLDGRNNVTRLEGSEVDIVHEGLPTESRIIVLHPSH